MASYFGSDEMMGSWLSKAFKKVSHAVAQIDPTNKNLPIVKAVTHGLAQIDPTNNSLPFAKEIQAGLNVVGTAVGAPGLGTVLSKVGQVHADIIHAKQKKPAAQKPAAVAKTTVAAAVKHGMTLVFLGKAIAIEYQCSKRNGGGDGRSAIYRHEFETPAIVCMDEKGKRQLYIIGNSITVDDEGIKR